MLPPLLRRLAARHHAAARPPGQQPGTLVYAGPPRPDAVRMRLFNYDADGCDETVVGSLEAVDAARRSGRRLWLDVEGVHDAAAVEAVGRRFGVHPLTLEDVLHPQQRPKLEEYDGYTYVVLQMMHYDHARCRLETEQVSLIVGDGFVLSFQEAHEGDVFDPVRTRLRDGVGALRAAGADYLAYALVDLVVDVHLVVLEGLGEHIEAVEDRVTDRPEPGVVREIHQLRHNVMALRRSIFPLREVVQGLEHSRQPFMDAATRPFLRDVYDHALRTVEIVETAREVLASMTDLYVSALNYRMSEVMKVLTIIATFFLPLSFIAGLYGMNFDPAASPFNMPELEWAYGYPFALLLMAATAGGMYVYFRRKGWL